MTTPLPAAFMDAGIDGVSYRQLDYWCRKGYLNPVGAAGSGTQRRWPEDEAAIARLMLRLVAAGLRLPVAADTARKLHGHARQVPAKVPIGPNVFVEVWPEAKTALAAVPAGGQDTLDPECDSTAANGGSTP